MTTWTLHVRRRASEVNAPKRYLQPAQAQQPADGHALMAAVFERAVKRRDVLAAVSAPKALPQLSVNRVCPHRSSPPCHEHVPGPSECVTHPSLQR